MIINLTKPVENTIDEHAKRFHNGISFYVVWGEYGGWYIALLDTMGGICFGRFMIGWIKADITESVAYMIKSLKEPL